MLVRLRVQRCIWLAEPRCIVAYTLMRYDSGRWIIRLSECFLSTVGVGGTAFRAWRRSNMRR